MGSGRLLAKIPLFDIFNSFELLYYAFNLQKYEFKVLFKMTKLYLH